MLQPSGNAIRMRNSITTCCAVRVPKALGAVIHRLPVLNACAPRARASEVSHWTVASSTMRARFWLHGLPSISKPKRLGWEMVLPQPALLSEPPYAVNVTQRRLADRLNQQASTRTTWPCSAIRGVSQFLRLLPAASGGNLTSFRPRWNAASVTKKSPSESLSTPASVSRVFVSRVRTQ